MTGLDDDLTRASSATAVEAPIWPRWRMRTILFCAVLGTGAGALLGVVTVASRFVLGVAFSLDELSEQGGASLGLLALGSVPWLLIGALIGSVFGLLLSPILFQQSNKPQLVNRAGIATLLGCVVAVVAGPTVWFGSVLFVGFAVIVSFSQAGRLFSAAVRPASVARTLAGPALSLLLLGAWAYMTRLPDDEAQLIALLGDDSTEKQAAVRAKLRKTAGVEAFFTALEHFDPAVRESAVRSIGNLESEDAVPALMLATQDVNQRVRVAALGALFHLGTEQPLLDVLADANAEMTRSLLFRVGWCGDASHIPALEPLLDHPDESVRNLAASTIKSVRGKTVAH